MEERRQTPAEILKKIRTLEIKTRGLVETAFAGDYHSVFKGRGMNFEDVREYQPGDEIRTIDWNVTARLGTAYVKKFTEERELTVILVVDVSASGNFGSTTQSKRELAAEVACLLAFSAIRNNDKVGLILFTDRVELFIPPKKGRSHTLRLIREILFFEPQGRGTEPVLALDYLNNTTPPIAGRAGALAIWSTNTKPIFRARSGGTTSTRSRYRQEGIICRRCARSSSNANAVYPFGE